MLSCLQRVLLPAWTVSPPPDPAQTLREVFGPGSWPWLPCVPQQQSLPGWHKESEQQGRCCKPRCERGLDGSRNAQADCPAHSCDINPLKSLLKRPAPNPQPHLHLSLPPPVPTLASRMLVSTRATPWFSLNSWILLTLLNSDSTVVRLVFRSMTWLMPCRGPTSRVVAGCFSSWWHRQTDRGQQTHPRVAPGSLHGAKPQCWQLGQVQDGSGRAVGRAGAINLPP